MESRNESVIDAFSLKPIWVVYNLQIFEVSDKTVVYKLLYCKFMILL